MTRIFKMPDARQGERDGSHATPLSVVPPSDGFPVGAFDLTPESEQEMVLLYKNIENLLPGMSGKVLQFTGAHEHSGTSTVARSFAAASAFLFGKKTVLVDADFTKTPRRKSGDPSRESGMGEALQNMSPEKILQRFHNTNLYLCSIASRVADLRRGLQAPVAVELWGLLKSRFDLVVVDSAPASRSPESISMSRTTDGVVFVVEAEGTRRPVARNGMEAVLKAGGNVLGVAFNKRRFYIPESLYRNL